MPRLASKKQCTGCTACAAVCPQACIFMESDKNGFRVPKIDRKKCISCGMCEKTCPVMHPLGTGMNLPEAYAAYSRNEAVRMQSSSGGVFTELAKIVLKQGGAVFGAAYTEQFEVVHICVEDEMSLEKLQGAKYAQSQLVGIFSDVKARLGRGQVVLFCGTPCQVAGLKAYLKKDYVNLILVDFICHSVPSPMAWKEYVKFRACQDNDGVLPEKINLRDKTTGWSRYQHSNLFSYGIGKEYLTRSSDSLYMKLFTGGYISRESCANCRFKGYSRASDLTLGDFWGIWDVAPEMDDNRGTSVVLVQTEKGALLLSEAESDMILKTVNLDEVSKQNAALLESHGENEDREIALRLIRRGRMASIEKLFAPSKHILWRKIRRKACRMVRKGYKYVNR